MTQPSMILAPMQGLTELLFRRAYEDCFPHAIGLAVAPFLSLTQSITQKRNFNLEAHRFADILPSNNEGSIPVVPQILGKEPEEFVALANMLFDIGYAEVNWNIGCPMRAITSKHRGSGILPYPDEVEALLTAVLPRLKPQLSIKMRIGLKVKSEIFSLLPILNAFPLASITIHPRLGRQQYSGQCDLDTFGQALAGLRHPVIYNGDIVTLADTHRIHSRFPQIATIMVGRGVLYNPSLPLELNGEQLSSETRHSNACLLIRHLVEAIRQHYPNHESAVRKTKEYWSLLWHSLPISEAEARSVLHSNEMPTIEKLIDKMTQ